MRILFVILFSVNVYSQNIENLLVKLDSAIELKESYTKQKINNIDNLKSKLDVYKDDNNNTKEYKTCLKLFYEYQSFVYDSAFYYIEQAKQEALAMDEPISYDRAKIKQGFVLLSSGLFKEAIDTLQSIRVNILPDSIKAEFYSVFARSYFDLADYGHDPYFMKIHKQKGISYLDTALIYTPVNSNEYWAIESLRRMKEEDWSGAKHAFSYWVNNYDLPKHYEAIATSSLGYIYSLTGATNNAIEYLVLAAITDIKNATKETVALRNLAKILFDLGYKKRAYDYIILAMEDATYYNARHRKIEIATILPIIEGERLILVESQKSKLIWLIAVIIPLAIFFFSFLVIIYKQLTKLKKARSILQSTIKNLNSLNAQLKETDKIKEEYIGYFLSINSEYIDKLDKFQQDVLRKINKKHYDDLLRLVKNTNMRKERQILFHQFDVVFLKIFPNFIKDFNALFLDNDQVIFKKNELLNSELRIFGLIRLGITDNEKIAKFLNFSVTTVYTYKTKIKAKSIYKNDFDEKLMAIKAF